MTPSKFSLSNISFAVTFVRLTPLSIPIKWFCPFTVIVVNVKSTTKNLFVIILPYFLNFHITLFVSVCGKSAVNLCRIVVRKLPLTCWRFLFIFSNCCLVIVCISPMRREYKLGSWNVTDYFVRFHCLLCIHIDECRNGCDFSVFQTYNVACE